MISKIKPQINKVIEDILAPVSKNWNPNVITILSLFLALIPTILFARGFFVLGAFSLILFGFDLIDGAVARINSKTSEFGGFLDAVCDRIADGVVLLGIAASNLVDFRLVIIAIISSMMVSYTKAKGEVVLQITKPGTNELSIGFAERTERLVIIFVFAVLFGIWNKTLLLSLNIMEWGMVLLSFLSILTTLMRVGAVKKLI